MLQYLIICDSIFSYGAQRCRQNLRDIGCFYANVKRGRTLSFLKSTFINERAFGLNLNVDGIVIMKVNRIQVILCTLAFILLDS